MIRVRRRSDDPPRLENRPMPGMPVYQCKNPDNDTRRSHGISHGTPRGPCCVLVPMPQLYSYGNDRQPI